MMNFKMLSAALVIGLGAVSVAQARTIHLGNVDGETRYFGNTVAKSSSFTDLVRFHIGEASSISGTFASFFNVIGSSFSVELQERTAHHWTDVGSAFTSSFSFADLSKGAYRFEITGLTGRKSGLWIGNMTVAAVPEADVWMMMLVGAGLIGYQLRRKQNSLTQPPIAG